MVDEILINYGVLGCWTAVLLGERFVFQRGIKESIDKLTEAINRKL